MAQKVKFGLLIVLCLASLATAADFEQKISRRFDLTAAGSVDLSNINGRIDISTRPGGSVEVLAVKSSDKKGEIETVDVIFEHQNDNLRIHTKYNKKNTRAKVDFTVVVPEKLSRSSFRSINGAVKCSGTHAELLLKSVNGRIAFDGDFTKATISAVNGAVEVSQEAELHGDLSVETVNGGIVVEIHRKSAFSVEGSTVNGGIVSEFPVTVERHLVGSSIHGSVNGGGRRLTLETVNGRIRISKI
jgi:DUF4097 and DUF4098 domain-containing protein YvlB